MNLILLRSCIGVVTSLLICALPNSMAIDAPTITSISNDGSTTSLRVTWTPPAGVLTHEVTWSPPDDNGTSFDLGPVVTEYTITGLTPGTLYNVTVIAKNGTSDTNEDTSSGRTVPSPVTLSESGATNDSISANWTTPVGVVDQYLVVCSDGTVDPASPIQEDGQGAYEATCMGLSTAGANYTIAVTSQSGSENSAETSLPITALPNSVDLMEGDSEIDSVSAMWGKPDGEIASYVVQCSSGTVVSPSGNQTGNGPFSASCTNLPTPGDAYSMNVTSLSNGKTSAVATIDLRALPNSVNLTDGDSTVDSVSATWNKPDGVVDSYSVQCSDGTTMSPTGNQTGDGPFSASCTNLPMAGDAYTMNVTSFSNGKMSAVTTIELRALPNPVVLTAGDITTRQIKVRWDDPVGVESSFEVDCDADGNADVILTPANAIGNTFEATCDVMTAGAAYSITVTSVSGNEVNAVTETFTAATPDQVNINTTSSNTTSITVTWAAIATADGFEVTCPSGSDPSPPSPLGGGATQASCVGVTPGGNHSISIVTQENNGQSPPTVAYVVAVPEAVVLSEEPSNNTAISASWSNPPGVVDTFSISCSNGTASPTSIAVTDPPANSYTAYCINLPTPGLEYTLTVVSNSNGQQSAESSIGIHALPSGVTLTEGPSTTTSVNASWMQADGSVDSYNIECPEGGDPQPSSIEDTTQLSYSASCINLPTAGERYEMEVFTVVDNGNATTESFIYLFALPEQVIDLRESAATTDSVSASWKKPSGTVSEYTATCPNGIMQTIGENNDGSERSVTCDGLQTAGADYTITVVALSNGKTSAPATVDITAFPNPVVLTAGVITTRQITVNWTNPPGEEDYYEVDCGVGTGDVNVTASPFQATCNVSTAGANYDITVTSVSGNKRSPVTETFTAATPVQVTFGNSSSNTTAITITWDSIPSADEFEIICSKGNPSPNSSLPATATEVSCVNVTSGGNHSISVVTVENNGRSSAIETYVVAVPNAVNLMEASDDVTTDAIYASWAMPNGIVEYFTVDCPRGNATPATVAPLDPLLAGCTGLQTPGDDYDISVASVSGGQNSETDTITITALPEAVNLQPGESNITVISASWTIPGSVVDTFTITCSNGTALPTSISVESSQAGETLTAYCIDLPTSGVEYRMTVVAVSKDKESAESSVDIFALPLGVNLTEGESTLTTVSATWMRQEDAVDRYSISCTSGNASPATINETTLESYTASCVNLPNPGATYTMTVNSVVGTDANSDSSPIQLVTVPESVESVSVMPYTTTTATVRWQLKDCSACVYNYFALTFEPDTQDEITVDYQVGTALYTYEVTGLTQGRSYNFTVASVSGRGVSKKTTEKRSAEETVEQRTVPASATALTITPDKTSLALTWTGAAGDENDYIITLTPSEGTATFNGDLSTPGGEVTGLTPGKEYNVSVVTVSGDESSEALVKDTRTLTDIPSPVQNPVAEVLGKDSIRLTFEAPANPNGVITSYNISYVGSRPENADHVFSSTFGNELEQTFTDLRAGFSYVFMIIAVNDGGYESEPASTEAVVTDQEPPADVPADYPYEENVPETGTTSFTVVLPSDLFSHANGELLKYDVIVTRIDNDPLVATTILTYSQASEQSPPVAYITVKDIPYPFSPTFDSSRRRRATEESATVVIGNGSCSGSPIEYCNAKLSDDTQYYYAYRAYNSEGSVSSSTFGPVRTVKDNTAGIAAGVTVSVVTVVMVIIISFVIVRKRQNNKSPRPSIEGIENSAFDNAREMDTVRRKPGSSLYKKKNSKPILLSNFEDHYRRMKADSDYRFTEEYDEIRQVGKNQPVVAAHEMINRPKNRFTNILPYEHSRVKLAAQADEPDTDYINANYMPGYSSPREFIACQGPLPGTVDDMWRMIWEKNMTLIVMLTQLVEKGKIKCHQYWPDDYNPITYGAIDVSLQAVQQYENWTVREFSISMGDEIRKLTQHHYTSWPDHGVPEQTGTMLDFVRTVRENIQKVASDYPVCVHCSAGVGRTGTYIALDRLMQAMQENDFIDIFGIICEMRMQRNHMVQTEKQYIFIHECVMSLIEREDDTGESIYVNLRSNGYSNQEDVNENLLQGDHAV